MGVDSFKKYPQHRLAALFHYYTVPLLRLYDSSGFQVLLKEAKDPFHKNLSSSDT